MATEVPATEEDIDPDDGTDPEAMDEPDEPAQGAAATLLDEDTFDDEE